MFDLCKDLKTLRRLLCRHDQRQFVLLLVLMLFAALLEAVGIGAVPLFVSLIIEPSSLATIPWIGIWFSDLPHETTLTMIIWASILLFAFVVLKSLFLVVVEYLQTRIVADQRLKLGDRLFRAYQSAPYAWHLKRSSSELLRNMENDTAQVLYGYLMPFFSLVMALIMSAFIILVMVLSTPLPAVLSLLVIISGLLAVIRATQGHMRHIGKVGRQQTREVYKAIQQGFAALVDARIIGCEDYLRQVHKSSLEKALEAQRLQVTLQKAMPYMIEILVVLGLLTILILLVATSDKLSSVLPVFALIGVATLRLKQMASQIASAINQMNMARAHIPGIVDDIEQLEAIEKFEREQTSVGNKIGAFRQLSLENVNYRYPDGSRSAIENVSLEIRQGESIAFVGETGCGKTTLINLILGLLEPTGSIRVNDIEIHEDLEGWRHCLGYISQSIYLIDDSIRANVAFGVVEAEIDEARVLQALKTACLDEFVATLPQGLDTVVGENAVCLSGGQRQRLGIARALYTDPEVLVMDEATSALDAITEEKLLQAIHNLRQDRTLIIVAHRMSTVEGCDRLYRLQDGKIEAAGNPVVCMAVAEAYRKQMKA